MVEKYNTNQHGTASKLCKKVKNTLRLTINKKWINFCGLNMHFVIPLQTILDLAWTELTKNRRKTAILRQHRGGLRGWGRIRPLLRELTLSPTKGSPFWFCFMTSILGRPTLKVLFYYFQMRARPKKDAILVKIFQKCPKTAFLTCFFFQKFACSAKFLLRIESFYCSGSARNIKLVNLKRSSTKFLKFFWKTAPSPLKKTLDLPLRQHVQIYSKNWRNEPPIFFYSGEFFK